MESNENDKKKFFQLLNLVQAGAEKWRHFWQQMVITIVKKGKKDRKKRGPGDYKPSPFLILQMIRI